MFQYAFSIMICVLLQPQEEIARHDKQSEVERLRFMTKILGTWKTSDNSDPNDESADEWILFEPTRCVQKSQHGITYYRAEYEPGKVTLRLFQHVQTLEIHVDPETLKVQWNGLRDQVRNLVLKRCLHPQLEEALLELGTQNLDQEELSKIQEDLKKRYDEDQSLRADPSQFNDPELMQTMYKKQIENADYMADMLKKFGWIDSDRFGEEASNAAFILVQHSGRRDMLKTVLNEIEKELSKYPSKGPTYALLFDRTQLYHGLPQKYGTQIDMDANGQPVVKNLLDPEKVEEYRKEVGLKPLKEYLDRVRNYLKSENNNETAGF